MRLAKVCCTLVLLAGVQSCRSTSSMAHVSPALPATGSEPTSQPKTSGVSPATTATGSEPTNEPSTSGLPAPRWSLPPMHGVVDYQLGGGYPPPAGVTIVSRDVTADPPLGLYGICYVNAFQTQPGSRGTWPVGLVTDLEDPGFPGEYLIDISTPANRRAAAAFLTEQIHTCATKGFQGVEFDNLDSWTRMDGTPRAGQVPFGIDEATDFAARITAIGHDQGLAVAQKNTPQFGAQRARTVGFDFAVSEECARYDECDAYRAVFDNHIIDIEYDRQSFDAACRAIGAEVSVVLRDRALSRPGSATYQYASCP